MSALPRTLEPRHIEELTEDTLLDEGLIVQDEHGNALAPGVEIAVGGFPAEAVIDRIIGGRLGVFTDMQMDPREWRVVTS